MKGLKKIALATAVAAAPFAQAELKAMDDALLADMTGQAGVSIELSAQVSVGSFVYTDTDGLDPSKKLTSTAASAGSLAVNNIRFGGAGALNGFADADTNNKFDDVKIDIDVDGSDGLFIHLGGTNLQTAVTGQNPVDFGLFVNDVTVNNTATLASGIAIAGNLGPIDIEIANSGVINVEAYFEVLSGAMNIDVLGMGITNLTVGDNNSPISSGRYASKIAAVQQGARQQNAATIQGGGQQAVDGLLAQNPGATQAEQDAARAQGEASATAQVDAAAIAGVSNMAYAKMTIQTGVAQYLDTTTYQMVNVTNALEISVDAMAMDIAADISLGSDANGARSLGSVAINDLDLTGTTLKIYGH